LPEGVSASLRSAAERPGGKLADEGGRLLGATGHDRRRT
jgi:hypothetical protein